MVKKIWFCSLPRTSLDTKYIQSSINIDLPLMVKSSFPTLKVDLTQPEEKIIERCTSNCRNEIRKGEKIGLNFHVRPPTEKDADFINDFLGSKNLGRFNRDYLCDLNATMCMADLNGATLAVHMYIAFAHSSCTRLVYSAVTEPSPAMLTPAISTNRLLGVANRFLHFQAIRHFKAKGLATYDFGGIGIEETDPKIRGINEFKRSFGGIETVEFNYYPLWIFLSEKFMRHLRSDRFKSVNRVFQRLNSSLKVTK